MLPDDQLMRHKEVADYYRMSTNALNLAYCKRKRWLPPRFKLGNSYRYRRADVIAALKPADIER